MVGKHELALKFKTPALADSIAYATRGMPALPSHLLHSHGADLQKLCCFFGRYAVGLKLKPSLSEPPQL
jgi:hypothetical protein